MQPPQSLLDLPFTFSLPFLSPLIILGLFMAHTLCSSSLVRVQTRTELAYQKEEERYVGVRGELGLGMRDP